MTENKKSSIENIREDINKKIDAATEGFSAYEKKRQFESDAQEIVKLHSTDKKETIKNLDIISKEATEDINVRYFAFFIKAMILRRNGDIVELRAYVEENEDLFKEYLGYRFTRNLMQKYFPNNLGKQLIDDAKKIYEESVRNSGYAHNFAETVCLVFENKPEVREKFVENGAEILEQAKNTMETIVDDAYPKFYATYGRVLGQQGDYKEAVKQIELAIYKEDSTRNDYPLVIINYNNNIYNIKKLELESNSKKQMEKIQEEYTKILNEQMKQNTTKTMELFGIFLAILAFTIGGLNFIDNSDFDTSARLLVVLFGSIIFVYSWGLVLIKKFDWKPFLIAIGSTIFILTMTFLS